MRPTSSPWAITDRLLSAIQGHDVKTVMDILSTNVDLRVTDSTRKTPLFHAVNTQKVQMVEALIRGGADVNQASYVAYHRDNQLCSCVEPPIVTATRLGNKSLVELLLSADANVDLPSEIHKRDVIYRDMNGLHFACEDNNLDLVKLLLAHDADVNLEDRGEETALHKAVRCNKNCSVQCEILQLLCEHGSHVDHINKLENSALYLATFYGCLRKMEILLLYGADVNPYCKRENSYGTPLHIVATRDAIEMFNMLILHGAQLNHLNTLECTPLHLNINTMIKGKVAKLLVYHGAKVSSVDKWNYTLMASCIRNMRIDCELLCQVFVYAGCDMNKEHWLKPLEYQGEEAENIPHVPIAAGRVERLCEWLRERQINPLSLSQLSRIAIRHSLSLAVDERSIVNGAQALPLPHALCDYILLKEYLDVDSISKECGKPIM